MLASRAQARPPIAKVVGIGTRQYPPARLRDLRQRLQSDEEMRLAVEAALRIIDLVRRIIGFLSLLYVQWIPIAEAVCCAAANS